jgi:hypothetical protein
MATNQELESDVREELAWDPRFDSREIFVIADHGRITLTGSVSSESARTAAEVAAGRVLGVRSIDNQLAVFDTFDQQEHGAQVPSATRARRLERRDVRMVASGD